MKVILQHTDTGLYLIRPGLWTYLWEEAQGFETSDAAISYALDLGLSDLQAVLKTPNARSEAVVTFCLPADGDGDSIEKHYSFRKASAAEPQLAS